MCQTLKWALGITILKQLSAWGRKSTNKGKKRLQLEVFHKKALYTVSISIIILFTLIYSLIIDICYVGTCATLEMEDAKITKIREIEEMN